MEDSFERIIESVLSDLVSGLLSFVLANLVSVFIVALIAAFLVGALFLNIINKRTKQSLQRTTTRHEQTSMQLNEVMTSNVFKDLELGFVFGETRRRMEALEKTALSLHQQAEQMNTKLKGFRVLFFSLIQSQAAVRRLEEDVYELAQRLEACLSDLSAIERAASETDEQLRPAKERYAEVSAMVTKLAQETSYPLDHLQRQLKLAEDQLKQAEQSAAFDAIRLKAELGKFYRMVEPVHNSTLELQKNFDIFAEIRLRLKRQEEQLLEKIRQEGLHFQNAHPTDVLRKTDAIIERLEASLRSGKQMNMRSAAMELEQILQEAVDLLGTSRPNG